MRTPIKLALGAAIVLIVASVGTVLATSGSGVTSTTLAISHFDGLHAKTTSSDWQARIDVKGATDVQVLKNVVAPGGTFGWHSHPGPSIVVVQSGTLWLYDGDDPTCTPRIVTAGSGFVDDGGDTHVVRNEGDVETVVYVTSFVPQGAARRIDEPNPGVCPF
jgi:quercetin dioxygenase-like cupin family protein